MTTAIDVVTRALQGDNGARSFLEQTCSIYVLDMSRTEPKILGCWTFLQEGLNELDRYESSSSSASASASASASVSRGGGRRPAHTGGPSLLAPAKLLAEMGLCVSRRSNEDDDALVRTCMENGRMHGLTTDTVQANGELRERVIARMAALAFDGNESDDEISLTQPIIREAFSAAIAANAVSNLQIEEFVGWIMSNKRSLPPFAVACVLRHVSVEASFHAHQSSSNDTDSNIETLQKLSTRVVSELLGPIWRDTIHTIHTDEMRSGTPAEASSCSDRIQKNSRTASKTLEAIAAWSRVTGLSLPSLRHLLKQADIELSDQIVATMGINEPKVLGSLADWLEETLHVTLGVLDDDGDGDDGDDMLLEYSPDKSDETIKDEKMQARSSDAKADESPKSFAIRQLSLTQMRYVMGVDEASFQSISQKMLENVECSELKNIILALVHSTALQRFRLAGLINARHDDADDKSTKICLSLTRIAVVLCLAYRRISQSVVSPDPSTYSSFQKWIPSVGYLDFFFKCASSPIISLSALVLPLTAPVLTSETGLATQWLPTLQRLAIIPHHDTARHSAVDAHHKSNEMAESDGDSIPSLIASDSGGDSFDQFIVFRDNVLANALKATFRGNKGFYLASCTSAVEEFCCDQQSLTEQTSFHLEAALFCLSTVGPDVMHTISNSTSDHSLDSLSDTTPDDCLERCALALSKKPAALTSNPLTLLQVCRFIDMYHKWFSADKPPGVFDIAVDLILTVILLCSTDYPEAPLSIHIYDECGIGPYSRAAQVLSKLMGNDPSHFLTNKSIASLGAAWEASFTACNRGKKWLSVEDRKEMAHGVCVVLGLLRPIPQQQTSILAFAIPSLCCIDAMAAHAGNASTEKELDVILNRLSDEISLLTTVVTAFSDPPTFVCQRAWPTLNQIALKYCNHPYTLSSLVEFMNGCVAEKLGDDGKSVSVLQELFKLSTSLVMNSEEDLPIKLPTNIEQKTLVVQSVLDFLSVVVDSYADLLNRRGKISNDFQKTAKSVIEVGGFTEPCMGQRTESGQLAFESSASNKLALVSAVANEGDDVDNEAEDGNNETSGTNEQENKLDGAVSSFLSLVKAKCPSLVIGTS
eukprot:CAMPEP_0113519012 /NCGR_PEP_ID=MMETSP0014_2-20120614/43291_1 /TAXON_ID=2857 /ORGANISM="Nitzschia sp." /LENGTH=1102 /DNA_ID=CAMNT_0000416699 /DNA_START=565 /DNA_END=3873 /DNA_ORIENTATION=- /assembly_acc=CAM_ASM_000159